MRLKSDGDLPGSTAQRRDSPRCGAPWPWRNNAPQRASTIIKVARAIGAGCWHEADKSSDDADLCRGGHSRCARIRGGAGGGLGCAKHHWARQRRNCCAGQRRNRCAGAYNPAARGSQKGAAVWLSSGSRERCCGVLQDRKSTRLNSSHANISYAVFCLKKKKKK